MSFQASSSAATRRLKTPCLCMATVSCTTAWIAHPVRLQPPLGGAPWCDAACDACNISCSVAQLLHLVARTLLLGHRWTRCPPAHGWSLGYHCNRRLSVAGSGWRCGDARRQHLPLLLEEDLRIPMISCSTSAVSLWLLCTIPQSLLQPRVGATSMLSTVRLRVHVQPLLTEENVRAPMRTRSTSWNYESSKQKGKVQGAASSHMLSDLAEKL
jgi:hypothetical protein